MEELGERAREHAEDADPGEHDRHARESAGGGDRRDVPVPDGGEGDDAPPQRIAYGRELFVGRVLSLVGGQPTENDDRARDQRHLSQPGSEASEPGGASSTRTTRVNRASTRIAAPPLMPGI